MWRAGADGIRSMSHQHRAGTVYGSGLRRCLIIFDPQALILDRRTLACRTPSPPWLLRRSKNFTSGVAIAFTSSASIIFDWILPHLTAQGPPDGNPWQGGAREQNHIALIGPQGQHNSVATSGRCFAIPRMIIQPIRYISGRLEHIEFSRVALMVDSGW